MHPALSDMLLQFKFQSSPRRLTGCNANIDMQTVGPHMVFQSSRSSDRMQLEMEAIGFDYTEVSILTRSSDRMQLEMEAIGFDYTEVSILTRSSDRMQQCLHPI